MIEIEHLSKYFGDFRAVNNLSFQVKTGEVLGFLGPNGAGKSTTMKMITGFLSPSDGVIRVCGLDMQESPRLVKQQIGYLPEGAPAYADMTPWQFLHFVAEIRGFSGKEQRERVLHVIDQLQLNEVAHKPIETLSKGFKRRVGLAQAIIHDPKVLILDEPTDGLDPNQKHQVRELIRSMSKDKIVIVSTHILEEVTAVCSRAMIISRGEMLFDGTPEELQQRSKYHQAITLRFTNSPDPQTIVNAIAGVESFEVSSDGRDITLFAKSDVSYQQVREEAEKHQWNIKGVFLEQGRMDDVFRSITEEAA